MSGEKRARLSSKRTVAFTSIREAQEQLLKGAEVKEYQPEDAFRGPLDDPVW
jgi:hypothetical protein